ncbi:MAG: YkgJ family cysteine cluster protein [Planctomycetota bacterium]
MSAAAEPGADAPTGPASGPTSAPTTGPWYRAGLRFECTACGKCCLNHGDGYEYVFSTRRERAAIAASLDLNLAQFETRFTERVGGDLSFKSRDGGCIFLEGGRCSIYALRPSQCRTFPFWPELLRSEAVWNKDVAAFCPGVGQGPVHNLAAIQETARQARP